MAITDPDWVPPIEIDFDVGKPIRSEQGLLLAGNPIAIAKGKPGAPRLHGKAAILPNEIEAELPVITGVTATDDTLSPINFSAPLTGVFRVWTLSGTLRFTAIVEGSSSGGSTIYQLRKNGTSIYSISAATSAVETGSVDAASVTTDTWEWVRTNGNGSIVAEQVKGSDGYIRVGIPIKGSEFQ